MPKVNVEEGNLVNIPVKVFTNGKQLGALQLDLKYDTSLLEFKKLLNSEKSMKWISYSNPSNGIVSWGGFDITNLNLLNDGEQVFALQFVAKKPQSEWASAALWTGEKYVGDNVSKDMNITPAMGIIEVRKMAYRPKINPEVFELRAIPNPSDGDMSVAFNLVDEGKTELAIFNMQGQKIATILNESMPKGEYVYSVKLSLPAGIYFATVNNNGNFASSKILINK
jgi:hypothetical protein